MAHAPPRTLINRIHMQQVRVYASAQNLLTFTRYEGGDPEVNADYLASGSNIALGTDFYSAPQARTITFGISLGF